jgi:CubicO group peptidase (beta-lactamase class C family)
MIDNCPGTRALLEEGIAQGLHLGAQLYVSHRGETLADMAVGRSRPGVPMTPDTINLWRSSGKPITAAAIAQLWERGRLDLDNRVAKHIPEFGVRGKETITIRHLLTHTGGFRAVIGLSWNDSFEQAVAKICRAPLEPRWIPGQTAGYHAFSSWYILAEIVRRLDGRPFDQYTREEIFVPLGMNDSWVSMSPESYRGYGNRIGLMFETREPGQQALQPASEGNGESDAAAIRPSSNARGPIRELARFYERLNELLKPETVHVMTSPQRQGLFDLTFKHVMDWGLGFILNTSSQARDMPYGYGDHASSRTFGHSGQESSCGFCDPEHGLVVAWICNGMPGESTAWERQRRINSAVYSDVQQIDPEM